MSLDRPRGDVPAAGAEFTMRVLVVEDDERFARRCSEVLRTAQPGCQITVAPDLHRAISALQRNDHWDLVVTDVDLPDGHSALETVRTVVTAAHPTPVVVVASATASSFQAHAVDVGAQDVVAREEFDARTLTRVVRHSLERSRLIAQVREMCLADPLTGLPNRRLWKDRCRVIFAGAARRTEQIAVLFLDVDGFKRVNEMHGHTAGDMVLQTAARTLGSIVRSNDTAARISGDEFCVVAAVTNRDEAQRMALRVATALRSVGDAMTKDLRFTVSIGATLDDPSRSTPERATDKAEAAMRMAKAAGPGRVRWFGDPAMATGV